MDCHGDSIDLQKHVFIHFLFVTATEPNSSETERNLSVIVTSCKALETSSITCSDTTNAC